AESTVSKRFVRPSVSRSDDTVRASLHPRRGRGADMKLYTYFRSSAAYRVRIALGVKGISYQSAFVHLRDGEHLKPGFREVNPHGLVPVLEDEGRTLTQSLAIIEYLEEAHPEPP